MLDELSACPAVARDDVDDAGRQLGLAEDVGEQQRRAARLGGLEDDRVPAASAGAISRQHQREVPRDDLAGDADGRGAAVRNAYSSLSAQPA